MVCSFCGSNLHNINQCNDDKVGILYDNIQYLFILCDINTPNELGERTFTGLLLRRFLKRELAVIGVLYAGATTRHTKDQLANFIWIYFRHINMIASPPADPTDITLPLSPTNLDDPPPVTWEIDREPNVYFNAPAHPRANEYIINEYEYRDLIIYNQYNIDRLFEIRDQVIYILYLAEIRYIPINNLNICNSLIRLIDSVLFPDVQTHTQTHAPFDPLVRPFLSTRDETQSQAQTRNNTPKYNIIPELLLDNNNSCDTFECPICYEITSNETSATTGCGHKFCITCILNTIKTNTKIEGPSCALCRGIMCKCVVNSNNSFELITEYCK